MLLRRRYAVFVLLLLALLMVFGGCGKKKDVAQEDEYSGEVYPENGLPKEKKVTISAIYPVQGHGKEYIEYAAKTFEEKFPNVKIKFRYIEAGGSAYNDIIRAVLQGGDESEIYDWISSFPTNERLQLIEAGKLEPQDEIWERPLFDRPELKLKDVIKLEQREVYDKDGHIYSLPSALIITGVYYNKKMFEDIGLEEPKCWSDFVEVCAKIKAQGIYPMVMDGKHANNYFSFGWGTVPFAVGGEKYREDVYHNRPDIYIDKPFITLLERLAEFAQKGYIHPGTVSFDHTQSQMEFLQGKAAMITNGTWIANEMKEVAPSDFKWGFMPLPGNEEGKSRLLNVFSSGMGYIWKNKPRLIKQWVKEFNLWLFNLDVQLLFAKSGGVPTRSDFIDHDDMVSELSPSAKIALETLNEPDIILINTGLRERMINNVEMAKLHKRIDDCYVALISGQKTVAQVAKEINDQYMKGLALEKNKY